MQCLVMAADFWSEGSLCWTCSCTVLPIEWHGERTTVFGWTATSLLLLLTWNEWIRVALSSAAGDNAFSIQAFIYGGQHPVYCNLSSGKCIRYLRRNTAANNSNCQDVGVGCCYTAVNLRYYTVKLFIPLAAAYLKKKHTQMIICVFVNTVNAFYKWSKVGVSEIMNWSIESCSCIHTHLETMLQLTDLHWMSHPFFSCVMLAHGLASTTSASNCWMFEPFL